MVKVDSSAPTRSAGTRKASKKKSASDVESSFSTSAAGGQSDETPAAAPANDVKSSESLVGIQDVNQNMSVEQKSYQRGAKLLDRLELLRISLLNGTINTSQLQDLKDIANENVKPSENPELERTRRLIEQRIHIELAKLDR